ncbi:hypothetical protein [Deinococcus marmoris]|uniref:hypothetical protein n=1 Tax=Deinococcus marmoris TaxID=249408 RepID=UPI0015884DCD|nr:hypothetical protein [Deinococcus marmoris]
MIAILINVQGDIAVLYVFLDLVMTIVVATAWEWRAQGQKDRRGGGKYKAK